MPLSGPPAGAGALAGIPKHPLRRRYLYRIWRRDLPGGGTRTSPWWFASAAVETSAGGRFDLPAPMGTCYFGTRSETALLEALQMRLTNLPRDELEIRRIARINAPADAPDAAMLTARSAAGELGITAELWAGRDRILSQRWAAAIRRDGWWALYAGASHDPSGRLRSVALFDHAGSHPPSHVGRWLWSERRIDNDEQLVRALHRYGVAVREPGQLPWAKPGD